MLIRMSSPRLLLIIVTLGATNVVSGAVEADTRTRWTPPQRVLFVVVDSLRPDHLGFHGYDRPTSPHLDELARHGALFLEARSTSSWTKPAVASLFSGVGPLVHGVEKGSLPEMRNGPVDALSDAWVTLPELFQHQGFTTIGFSANPHVAEGTGLAQGFDRLIWSRQRGDQLQQRFLAWLETPYDWSKNAWQRAASDSENLLRDWRKLATRHPEPGKLEVGTRADRLVLRRGPQAGEGPVSLKIPLATRQGTAVGPHLLALRAWRQGAVKAKISMSEGEGAPDSRFELRFSRLEDHTADHRTFKLAGADLTLTLEVSLLREDASFELEEVFLLPETRVPRNDRWFAYLHFMQRRDAASRVLPRSPG